MKRGYLLLLLLATAAVSIAQPHRSWVKKYDGGFVKGGGDSSPLCVSDSAGNTYIAGITSAYELDRSVLSKNITIGKYDPQGMRKWVTTYRNADKVVAIQVDPAGNVYILADKKETLLLKYNQQGRLVWEWAYMGGVKNTPLTISLDPTGNVYVSSIRKHAPDSFDISVNKFSLSGVVEWTQQVPVENDAGLKAFADIDAEGKCWMAFSNADTGDHSVSRSRVLRYDSDGKILVDQLLKNSSLRGLGTAHSNAYLLTQIEGSGCDIQLVKLSNEGAEAWFACDAGMAKANALAIDNKGSVIIAGTGYEGKARITLFDSTGTGLWTSVIENAFSIYLFALSFDRSGELKIGGRAVTANGKENYFTAGYSTVGDKLWSVQYDAPAKLNDRMTGMTLLPDGKVVVTGESMYSKTKDFVTVCYDQRGTQMWVDALDGESLSMEVALAQDIDPFTGDIYVAGYGKGDSLGCDMLTLKFKADGSLAWARYFDGSAGEEDVASDIKVDGRGNVYVAGRSTDIMSPRVNGIRVIKYNEHGNSLWNISYPDTGYMTEQPLLALGKDGSVLVCAGSADFRMRVIKYTGSGKLVWNKIYKAPHREGLYHAASIKVDQDGNIYVAASSVPSVGTAIISAMKLSADGTLLWMREYLPEGSISAGSDDMEIDRNGNMYISGHFFSDDHAFRLVTVKYNTNGIREWVSAFDPKIYNAQVFNDVTLAADGSVYLMSRETFSGNVSLRALTSVTKLDVNGAKQWRQTLGDEQTSFSGNALALGRNGSIFITGSYYKNYFNEQLWFTAAVSPEGNVEWVDTINVPGGGQGYNIGMHPNGGVYISGGLESNEGDVDIGLVHYGESVFKNENSLAAELNHDISVYPDPAAGFILEVDAVGEVCIEILDLSGKKLQCINVNSSKRAVPVSVASLSAGSYVIRAVTDRGVLTRPLVVMRE